MMASMCLSLPSASKTIALASSSTVHAASSSSSRSLSYRCSFIVSKPSFPSLSCANYRRRKSQVVRMAPEEEKLTRRNPLDFPIEWERPKPGRRPDIFPQFSPMKTPLPPPMPHDPPEEDDEFGEEEEEEKEVEEDPEKEEYGGS
ncbi:hypothetical protein SLEP1_g18463 [Rubroshorea leprosula]|uniref:Uncharacterized protein n=1 Tax=Rubroshorea leprosula TaxID=152421 RepID=A0AAV5J6S4_9ROSI|nr:hypothetical protein SLEP1_g18463 [Rubroshorea leprosula]